MASLRPQSKSPACLSVPSPTGRVEEQKGMMIGVALREGKAETPPPPMTSAHPGALSSEFYSWVSAQRLTVSYLGHIH